MEFVYLKNLHAKLYMNEDVVITSSMNLTDSSRHNSEVGIQFLRDEDIDIYNQCFGYLMYVLQSDYSDINEERFKNIIPKFPFTLDTDGPEIKINGQVMKNVDFRKLPVNCNVKHGFCIRCESEKIEFNPLKPMCPSCFKVWDKYRNKSHEENCCHRCGVPANTYLNDALCDDCGNVFEFEIEREWNKLEVKDKNYKKDKPK